MPYEESTFEIFDWQLNHELTDSGFVNQTFQSAFCIDIFNTHKWTIIYQCFNQQEHK